MISLHLIISIKLGYSLAITIDFSTAFHMLYIHFFTLHYAYFSTPHPDPKPILGHWVDDEGEKLILF